jgi:uncharacterized protein
MAERFDGRVAAFPKVVKPESFGFREAPPYLMDFAPADVMWTVVSPPVAIEVDGPHTGSDRAADDEFAVDAESVSRISTADPAVAVVDEVENPKQSRRLAFGY